MRRLMQLERDFAKLERDMRELGSRRVKRVEQHVHLIEDDDKLDVALDRMIEHAERDKQ